MYKEPYGQPAQGEQRVWNIAGIEAGKSAKQNGKDRRRQNGLQDRPGYPDCRLFIADLDIAPH